MNSDESHRQYQPIYYLVPHLAMPRRVVNTTERDRDMPVSPYGAYENPSKQACLQGMDASGKGPVGLLSSIKYLTELLRQRSHVQDLP